MSRATAILPLLRNQIQNLRSPNVLGIDMGSELIKVLECDKGVPPLTVQRFSLVPASQTLAEGLGPFIQINQLFQRNASLSIADEKVESHTFQFPPLSLSEFRTALEFEMTKSVPSRDFIYYDCLPTHKPEGSEAICVLAPRDLVDQKHGEILSLGLKPYSLEPESSALCAVLSLFRPQQKALNAAILDLGYSAFRIIFVHNGVVSFTRSLYLGLSSICQQVATDRNVPLVEVTRILRTLKTSPGDAADPLDSQLERLFQESLYTLCEEFTRSEFYTKEQRQLGAVDEVFLCGGGACLPMSVEYTQRHLGKKIETLDVTKLLAEIPPGMDPTSGPLWACALGLGVRKT